MTLPAPGLSEKAAWVRHQILEMIASANKGHIGGSLSCVEILVTLYAGGVLQVKPENPQWPERDRFILSKGHAVEALYAVLAQAGFFSEKHLPSYGSNGTMLGGHPDRRVPGVEVSTGSLGQGLGIAAGLALAARRCQQDYFTFVLLGDGECYEGSVWEAALFAAHHELSNLVAIVDRNRQITLADTETCNRLEPLAEKWRAFNWEAREISGHSFADLWRGFADLRSRHSPRPLVILAQTVKGRGVSFMEREIGWHHRVPKGEQLEQARRELALNRAFKQEPFEALFKSPPTVVSTGRPN